MYHNKEYNRFVRPHSPIESSPVIKTQSINGDEVQRLYLEEINNVNKEKPKSDTIKNKTEEPKNPIKTKRKLIEIDISNNKLFLTVQNNDVETLREVLNSYPDKINVLDEYGWSLLMIACQADSRDCVQELLDREIDVNIRDKAGNSARSLVIRNKNVTLATLLLDYSGNCKSDKTESHVHDIKPKVKCKEQYTCDICNNTFPDKQEHLSSTIHNINASKGKKIPTNYVIPLSNKGFQILLKGGWDKETGLGPHGTGRKCPIKTIPKYDRKGLGHEKTKTIDSIEKVSINKHNKKIIANSYMKNKKMEIDFRREFY